MDFGATSGEQTYSGAVSAEPTDEKGHGSENLKHERSRPAGDTFKVLKMSRSGQNDFSSHKGETFAAPGRSNLLPPVGVDGGQRMLLFSSSESTSPSVGSGRSIAFSVCEDVEHSRTGVAVASGGGLSKGMRGTFARLRGPFTPSQWMELEHQALIYKHIVANVPVPSNLLSPLKRSLCPYGSLGSYASNFLGWGPLHLGYSGSNDPEPGRCRRTDGKKWRCSREAVPDQKYCERHINRGRHRSRKPVEGRTGHAVAGSTIPKVTLVTSSSSTPVISCSSAPDSLSAKQQFISLQTSAVSASLDHLGSRSQGFHGLSLLPPASGLTGKDLSIEVSPSSEFGLISADSLLHPSERILHMTSSNSDSFLQFHDWQTDQSVQALGSWPEQVLKSDWTQLSVSTAMARDFSLPSTPVPDISTVSTLRLFNKLDPIPMSLGVGHDDVGEPMQNQPSWLPVMWGNSVGGPLGEALTSGTTIAADGESFLSMNAWKTTGPQMGFSPTGVLHKTTFVSVSSTSSGSSPPSVDNKKKVPEYASLCNDYLSSALANFARSPSP